MSRTPSIWTPGTSTTPTRTASTALSRSARLRWLGFVLLALVSIAAPACSEAPETRTDVQTGTEDTLFPEIDSQLSSDVGPDTLDIYLGPTDETACDIAGGWGCPCKFNTDCISNYCIESAEGKVCTRTCSGSCPKDWECVQASGTVDLTYVCLPAFSALCKPCTSHADCATSGLSDQPLCIPNETTVGGNKFIDGSFCGSPCKNEGDCKEGYECATVTVLASDGLTPLTSQQCRPKPDDQGKRECTCTAAWTGFSASTSCERSNSYGVCKAVRSCVQTGGEFKLSLCTASTPEPEICGDSLDNDCDGETDEDGAVGCTVFYEDNDGDFYGIGVGVCLCAADPGLGYTKNGGDCNDYDSSIKPSANEICDSKDNNCNGSTDEAGSQGCKIYYADLDGDKFGDDDNSACMCASKKTADYIETPGDCDDGNKNIKPGVPEVCDGTFDNDCDGKTDEEGAEGCQLWFIDTDKDNYGPTASGKCLCKSAGIYVTQNAGDCNDVPTDAVSGIKGVTINPGAMEMCNNIDDDCSGITDDGLASAQCPAVDGGNAACLAGGICGVGKCANKKFDVNDDPSDGCECQADNNYGTKGQSCGNYIDLGDMPDGAGTKFAIGNIMPGEGGDWYHFYAKDLIDTDNGCDAHNVRVKFTSNPGDQYWFDVFRGSCSAGDQICANETDHSWGTSFYGTMPGNTPGPQGDKSGNRSNYSNAAQHPSGKSPVPEKFGECKCVTAESAGNLLSSPGVNICSDNSAHYFVRVFRKPGIAATCDNYSLRVDNSP